jgi:hypothetical protein
MHYKIGTDPEVFLLSKNTGKFVSASVYANTKGTKEFPERLSGGGAVQIDGMALEFNTDPVDTKEDFVNAVSDVMNKLKSMHHGFKLRAVPTCYFEDDVWSSTPVESLELGCNPDFDAWDGGCVNPPPEDTMEFRTGAGHIHVGWLDGDKRFSSEDMACFDVEHMSTCVERVKQLDCSLGQFCAAEDEDTDRYQLYGAPGAFRPKVYGLEYRSPSNWWLNSREYMGKVFDLTMKAMKDFDEGILYESILPHNPVDVMLKHDKERAKENLAYVGTY